jgi:hypothetical protein
MSSSSNTTKKKENIWVNLAFNIIIPAFILSKLSGDNYFGPTIGLIVALSFPLFYGLMDFRARHKVNIFSVLGVTSTLLTGTISLLELDPQYIAIKEATIPGIIFCAVLISTWTNYPLVEKLIFNDAIFDLEKLNAIIETKQMSKKLDAVLKNSSYLVASSFLFSSILNYILAKMIVVSSPGTEAYNGELGKLALYSYPVIALPCTLIMMASLFYLIHHLQKMTGESIEDFLILGKD